MFSLPDDIPAKKASGLERKTSGSRGRVQGVRTPPPPLRWSFRLRIYVLAFKSFFTSPSVTSFLRGAPPPTVRKILDPRLMACLVGNSTLQTSVTWKGKHPKNDIFNNGPTLLEITMKMPWNDKSVLQSISLAQALMSNWKTKQPFPNYVTVSCLYSKN